MVSIIIVNYHVKKELLDCLTSIYSAKVKNKFEIIVVDNDERKKIKNELLKQFPKIRYLANFNKGYGQGNNVGAKYAKGEYLFILNPDTKVYSQGIDLLVTYLEAHQKVGIAAPFLYKSETEIIAHQGTRILNPIFAIFTFSFFSKLFPNNPIAKKYWLFNSWNKKSIKVVESVPGTAFMIRKKIFEQIGGFDEKFFLYFEEQDLCKRVHTAGWKQVMLPQAKIIHKLGQSTKKSSKNIQKIFKESRYYYFKKHYGIITAMLTESVLQISSYALILTGILAAGLVLRTIWIHQLLPFIGDQGWFYLSARDLVLHGTIPFVGIESSHPWLHQGAFWTYLLGLGFFLFGFSPYVGAYLSIIFDCLVIFCIYIIGKNLFSRNSGLIAAALYAFSPAVIVSARMPYHTSLIPLISLFYLFFVTKWIQGNIRYFPFVILSLATLYNLELATFMFSFITGIFFVYGLSKKRQWATGIFNKKILLFSLICFIIPMLPMLIYDSAHGFPQTLKFLLWIGYRIIVFFGYQPIHPFLAVSYHEMVLFLATFYQRLLFPYHQIVAVFIIVLTFLYSFKQIISRGFNTNMISVFLIAFLTMLGIFFTKTDSNAYLPMLYPSTILLVAVVFNKLFWNKRLGVLLAVGMVVLLFSNTLFLLRHHYSFLSNHEDFSQRIRITRKIIKLSAGKEYNLSARVNNKELANYSKNYEYLTWWLGHGPAKEKQAVRIIVSEINYNTYITKEIK